MNKLFVVPINESGFALWESERHRQIPADYELLPDEAFILPDHPQLHTHRWDGKRWVEGKNHPKAPKPEPEPNPDFPEVQLPTEGIFRLLSKDIKPAQAEKCLLESDLTASYVAEHLYCLSDPRIVQALIDAVQKLNKRLSALEKQTSRKR